MIRGKNRKLECYAMNHDIQKASIWKRIAAGILDLILVVILATGFGAAISAITGYDNWNSKLDARYQYYIEKYSLIYEEDRQGFEALPEAEQKAYMERRAAANQESMLDQEAGKASAMLKNLVLVIVTGGILLAILVVEFIVPLIFKNGQTLGKKVFSLCLVRVDGVQLNGYQHFIRAILGKYAVETMIPVYVGIMVYMNQPAGLLLIAAAVMLLAQCVIFVVNRNHSLIHDLMAGTVVVDYGSQKIFKTTDDLIAYQMKLAADRAKRQDY